MRDAALVLIAVLTLVPPGYARATEGCGDLENHYGPFDYRTDKGRLKIVEQAHFPAHVENLSRGASSTIGDDLAYVLRAYPNHHRALISMMNLGLKLKTERPPLASHTVACFFDRAMRFQPGDPVVRMIFATYLSKHGKKDEAIRQLELALELGASGPNFEYNMGLAYFEVGDYEKSLRFAHRAYRGGFNLPGLKGKLVKAGKWQDPLDPPAATPKPTDAEAAGRSESKE